MIAHKHKRFALYGEARMYIVKHASTLFATQGFANGLSAEQFLSFLQAQTVTCREVLLFKRVVDWAVARRAVPPTAIITKAAEDSKEQQQQRYQPTYSAASVADTTTLLDAVRFGLMSEDEILATVFPTQLIASKRLMGILKSIRSAAAAGGGGESAAAIATSNNTASSTAAAAVTFKKRAASHYSQML
jgi:hypothetical protein